MGTDDGTHGADSAAPESLAFLDNPFETAATLPVLWRDFQRMCPRCEHHHLDPFGPCRHALPRGAFCHCRATSQMSPVEAAQAMVAWIVDWARVVDQPSPMVREVARLPIDTLTTGQWRAVAQRLAASPPPASLVLLINSVQAR